MTCETLSSRFFRGLVIGLLAFAATGLVHARSSPVEANVAGSLANLAVEIVDANSGEMPRRSQIAGIDRSRPCGWTIRFASGGIPPMQVMLGKLRYVQGDGTDLDLGIGQIDLIIRLGARGSEYDALLAAITDAARACGAQLAAPPMLVTTPRRH
jgi:hypothetical protein